MLVELPEEARVVEARFDYALVALPHQALAVGPDVHDGDELRRQLSFRVPQRKVALVVTHHHGQHLGRQLQEARIEIAEDRRRVLGQIRQVVEQRSVFDQLQLQAAHQFANAVEDPFLALLDGENDAVLLQPLFVVRVIEGDLVRACPPVAARKRAGLDPGELEFDHGVAEQGDDPANRADEAHAVLAGPIHRLRPRDLRDESGQRLGQNGLDFAPWNALHNGEVLTLGRGFDLQRRGVDAVFSGKSLRRAFACRFRRTQHQLSPVFLTFRQPGGAQHQPPRCRVEFQFGGRQAVLFEQRVERRAQMVERAGQHPMRDLFGADFQQERFQFAHATASVSTAC